MSIMNLDIFLHCHNGNRFTVTQFITIIVANGNALYNIIVLRTHVIRF